MSETNPTSDWRTLAADLFEKHHDEVVERLTHRNPGIDRHDLHDAFVTALLQIAAKPDKFDADQNSAMVDFLVGAGQLALLQILRTNRRRKSRDEKKAMLVVRDAPAARSDIEVAADAELVEDARKVAHTEEERNVLRLWELGHSDDEIATALGIVRADVKRIRDRLTQRLRRLGHELRDEPKP
jgi:DNA-directed RNA polymerase specialized sigma24 family protein